MRLPPLIALAAAVTSAGLGTGADALALPSSAVGRHQLGRRTRVGGSALFSSSGEDSSAEAPPAAVVDASGLLLTWDLDDTLYPVSGVIGRANIAFGLSMSDFGYKVEPRDINRIVKQIREEMAEDPELYPPTYAQLQMKAIRREMVKCMTQQNLNAVAIDEGTDVEKLTAPIRELAERMAQTSVDNSEVQAVYDAWERERHAAADRTVYPDVLPMLQQLKEQYPNVVMGAVTNGASNPLKMPDTLAPYFDFCVCWGDDGIARKPDRAIYEAAVERYKDFAPPGRPMKCWIHIGDDLAYDVGGSLAVGAKTIWTDLEEDYGQTAHATFDGVTPMPSWSTEPASELEMRHKMAEESRDKVTETVHRLSDIPDAVRRILKDLDAE